MTSTPRAEVTFSERQQSWFLGLEDLPIVVGIADLFAIVTASVLSGAGYHLFAYGRAGAIEEFGAVGALIGAILVPLLRAREAYDPVAFLNGSDTSKRFLLLRTLVLMFVIGLSFAFKTSELFSRGYALVLFVLGPTLVLSLRAVLRRSFAAGLRRDALRGRKVALLVQDHVASTQDRAAYARLGYVVARTHSLPADRSENWSLKGKQVATAIRGSDIDEVHVAADWNCWPAIKELVAALQSVPLPVRILPDATSREIMRSPKVQSAFGPAFELHRAPLTLAERSCKRAFDVVFAGAGLVALAPLLILVSIAIRLDTPGPVLFRQTRNGFNGRPFRIYKFRTMFVTEDGPYVLQAQRNDKRVTPIGRWLRRTSIDELPQIFNVLRGDMSLVGPRPHALAHDNQYEKIIANYAFRHHVKPGITGWAQVHGFRGETAKPDQMRRRVDLDLGYIANWSFPLDLEILARTIVELFRARNAY